MQDYRIATVKGMNLQSNLARTSILSIIESHTGPCLTDHSGKVIKYGENAVKGSVKRIQAVSEAINGLKEVRILGKERFFYQTVVKATSFQAKNIIRSQIITMSPKYFIELFLSITSSVSNIGISKNSYNSNNTFLTTIVKQF